MESVPVAQVQFTFEAIATVFRLTAPMHDAILTVQQSGSLSLCHE